MRMSEALKVFVAATTKSSSLRSERQLKVDLHGLHVKESLDVLEELLIAYKKAFEATGEGPRYLYVITGLGLHSQDNRARLRPAVIEYLRQHKYKFFDNGGRHTSFLS